MFCIQSSFYYVFYYGQICSLSPIEEDEVNIVFLFFFLIYLFFWLDLKLCVSAIKLKTSLSLLNHDNFSIILFFFYNLFPILLFNIFFSFETNVIFQVIFLKLKRKRECFLSYEKCLQKFDTMGKKIIIKIQGRIRYTLLVGVQLLITLCGSTTLSLLLSTKHIRFLYFKYCIRNSASIF